QREEPGQGVRAELVEHDEHAQRDDECHDRDGDVHAALELNRATTWLARARALASAASTSSSERSGPASSALSVSSMTAVICRNGSLPSRNAATPTSLAPLS